MFLITITKAGINDKCKSLNIMQYDLKPYVINIVIDNFLSKFISNGNVFAIFETPLSSSSNLNSINLGQITFKKDDNTLEIFKPTISGRPIYYHINSNGEFFCSTHISLLRKAGVTITENQKALPEFFVYRYVMPPRTLFKDIEQLVAGSRIYIELRNGRCQITSISRFNPPNTDEKSCSIDKISEKTLHLLTESMLALSPCKENLSVLLSGGLDSSILYQICRGICGIESSYSTGYPFEDTQNNSEKEYALSAADVLKTKHNYYEFATNEYLYGFIKAISAAEEPLHHLQSVLFYLLFERLPKNSNIVISGQGADGIFGLGLQYSVYRLNSLLFKLILKEPFKELLQIASFGSNRLQEFINNLIKTKMRFGNYSINNPKNIIWSLGCYGSVDWVCDYFKVSNFDIIEGRYSTIKSFENRSIYDVISLLDILGDVSITQSIWSKLCENHKKILYFPFGIDNLLNYIFSVPWDVKLKRKKFILRKVAKKMNIPDFIIKRPKKSFGITADKWSKKGGVFDPLIPLCSTVFDIKEILKMQSSDSQKSMNFWNILNYSVWKRLCINNEPVEVLLKELDEAITSKGN